MPALNRVPNGYPRMIKETKRKIVAEVEKMQQIASSMKAIKDVVGYLCQKYDVTNYYIDPNTNKMQVDMDFAYTGLVPISAYVQIDQNTLKFKLCDRIIVWTHLNDKNGEEFWVDNYKW